MSGRLFLTMNSYSPFLKLKSNEIIALGELESDVLENITPLFDFPRPDEGKSAEQFSSDISRLSRSVLKHIPDILELYIDTYDYDHREFIDGKYSYYRLVESFNGINVIPVISIDRSDDHLNSVLELKRDSIISNSVIALRFTAEDFENFRVIEDEIIEIAGEILDEFENIDVIFDCRVCTNLDPQEAAENILEFSLEIGKKFNVRNRIVTGSSIPASISDLLAVNQELHLKRNELDIYRNIFLEQREAFILGDYATVSPNYSEVRVMPEVMQNIMTAKLTYTYDANHFFIRGGSLKTNGYEQYFDLADNLVSRSFFRGETYSNGDAYFKTKSKRQGKNCMPGTIIKPSVNAHVSYMVKDFSV